MRKTMNYYNQITGFRWAKHFPDDRLLIIHL